MCIRDSSYSLVFSRTKADTYTSGGNETAINIDYAIGAKYTSTTVPSFLNLAPNSSARITFYHAVASSASAISSEMNRENGDVAIGNIEYISYLDNFTIKLEDENYDFFSGEIHKTNQSFPEDFYFDFSGKLGDSYLDDKYYFGNKTSGYIKNIGQNQYLEMIPSEKVEGYTYIYDNETTSDATQNLGMGWVHFNNTQNFILKNFKVYNDESGIGGVSVHYNGSNITSEDSLKLFYVFSNATPEYIDGWMLPISKGYKPEVNFFTPNQPPVIQNFSYSQKPAIFKQKTNFTANITDNVEVKNATISIHNGTSYNNYTMNYSMSNKLFYFVLENNTDWYAGTYNITIYAYDNIENPAEPYKTNFTIAPYVSISLTKFPLNFTNVEAGQTTQAQADKGLSLIHI